MEKIRWGILSTAKIATEHVIPAMQKSEHCRIVAIASRSEAKAQDAAKKLGIPRAYGSYEALLQDPEVDAIYNPLPNHLHVPWSIKALDADKHVLCEKPIALSAAEARQLLQATQHHPHLKVMEAFMYRHHPQWREAKRLVQAGAIGQVRTIQSFFSFYDDDPDTIVNKAEMGGGALMDIGCYSISLSRFIYDREPLHVYASMEPDPAFQVDRLTSGMMDFGAGTSTFTCSTQLVSYQHVDILGTKGRIEIPIPFNPPANKVTRIFIHTDSDTKEIVFEPCDQYAIQGDLFAQAILNNAPVPTPLEDAVANMEVLEAIVKSSRTASRVFLSK